MASRGPIRSTTTTITTTTSSWLRIPPCHGYNRQDQAAAEIQRAFYSYLFFEALPADELLLQIDYGGMLRGPWPLQNESDDDWADFAGAA
jgi:hypothetical protein